MSGKVTIWAWRQAVPNSTVRLVLQGMADIVFDHGRYYGSQKTLAEKIQMSERSVRGAIAVLKDLGIVRIEQRAGRTDVIHLMLTPVVLFENGPEEDGDTPAPPAKTPARVAATPAGAADDPDNLPRDKTKTPAEAGDLFGGEGNDPPEPSAEYLFDTWWAIYPLKKAKGAAEKPFAKAILKVHFDTLIKRTKRFAELCAGRDRQFIPNPSTWLNQRRWEDEDLLPPKVVTGEADWQ